jgi:hypothetical protein
MRRRGETTASCIAVREHQQSKYACALTEGALSSIANKPSWRRRSCSSAAYRPRHRQRECSMLRAAAVGFGALEQLFGPSVVVAAPSCEKCLRPAAVKASKPRLGVQRDVGAFGGGESRVGFVDATQGRGEEAEVVRCRAPPGRSGADEPVTVGLEDRVQPPGAAFVAEPCACDACERGDRECAERAATYRRRA